MAATEEDYKKAARATGKNIDPDDILLNDLVSIFIDSVKRGDKEKKIAESFIARISASKTTTKHVFHLFSKLQHLPLYQCLLGFAFEYGIGTKVNLYLAFICYKASSENFNSLGQAYLAKCYKHGKGTEKNNIAAFWEYLKSAIGGCSEGQYGVGRCHENGTQIRTSHVISFIQNQNILNTDLNSYELSCPGIMSLYQSEENTKNQRAFFWFKNAALSGNVQGQYVFAHCYEKGKGVTKNQDLAFYWYRRAALNGHQMAQSKTGFCYFDGNGVARNTFTAFEWFYKCARNKLKCAERHWVARCFRNARHTRKDERKAFLLYQMELTYDRNPKVNYDLASCFKNGWGTPKDIHQAIKLHRKSLKNELRSRKKLFKIFRI
ncbi:651_t:CDS:1 [Ambispora gerdemannii]|uniref:651_t:CDS:1 n=1 Tax=Ambispora gerdemannii TaxID=144530 RepID=A0A9N9F7M1_9GLOM|nr:651_t:CDS:1 [Ambispora gerdemannii]